MDFQTIATLVSVESISVKAGNFDAAKFDLFIRLAGTVNGNSFLIEGTESHWYAPGVGPVRIIPPPVANLNVNIIPPPPPTFTTWQLTQYYVPEPSTAASAGAALLAILALARRVRWPRVARPRAHRCADSSVLPSPDYASRAAELSEAAVPPPRSSRQTEAPRKISRS